MRLPLILAGKRNIMLKKNYINHKIIAACPLQTFNNNFIITSCGSEELSKIHALEILIAQGRSIYMDQLYYCALEL